MMQIPLPEKFDTYTDENHSVRTTASLSPESQYIQSVCLYCGKSKGTLVPLPTGNLAHVFCRENRPCCICGTPHMCLQCKQPDCPQVFHPFCLKRLVPSLSSVDQMAYCDLHSLNIAKKKRYLKIGSAKQIINKIGINENVLRIIKAAQGRHKQENVCSGNLLWLNIGIQYFWSEASTCSLPILEVKEDKELRFRSPKSDNFVEDLIEKYEKKLQDLEKEKNRLWPVRGACEEESFIESPYDYIFNEIKSLKFREEHENFLKYVESKSKQNIVEDEAIQSKCKDEVDLLFSENSNQSAAGEGKEVNKEEKNKPKSDNDYICEVCGDGDYEDDDLIVICSKCDMGVHTKCYGIVTVPENEWYCKACEENVDQKSLRCALCPIKGGALKPTINSTDCFDKYPNYDWYCDSKTIWVHLYCIMSISPSSVGDKISMSNIDISKIDKQKFTQKCSICNTSNGASIECQQSKCSTTFHPFCIKTKLQSTGYDDDSSYCLKHKPLKLRKLIENKDKKVIQTIMSFTKIYEKSGNKVQRAEPVETAKKKFQNGKPFNYEEKALLLSTIEERLQEEKKDGFSFVFKANQPQKSLRCKIDTSCPYWFTLIDPQIIIAEKLTIPGRKPEDCLKCYTDLILPLLKKELHILQRPKNVFKLSNKGKKRPRAERKTKRKASPLLIVDQPVLDEIVTEELHCICRKPFIEAAPQRPGESVEDWEKRVAENEMILCDQCESWYHLKCLGIKPTQVPEHFFCSKCNPKRTELCV
ncbi:unnamed protein product [Blepharisma stoltei]|uniref:Uncharacterized protein n=1 Tax=Blepharisma stoltei TaxID=1481888 RepID=A0AAU9JPX4_9CILI|nr:unnamed protein product [Blepharisma stoltei]